MRYRAILAFALAPLAACAPAVPTTPTPTPTPYDLLITGGRVVDGTGNPWYYGDIAIRGDRIAAIAPAGAIPAARAGRTLDARGLVVAPGFIDLQGHSYNALLRDGRAVSKVMQGVTTEIMGEGTTPAPRGGRIAPAAEPGDTAAARRDREWRSIADWLLETEQRGASLNIGTFIGAGTVREYVLGMEARAPTPAELDSMRAVVARAMQDGAFGVASALIYPPDAFASTDELVALAAEAARHGGIYVTHMRSEADQLLEALAETLEIGRRAAAPVEIYHLKAAGRRNWHKFPSAIAMIDSARAAGLDVTANVYPYTAAGTGLTACLPPWTAEGGRLYETLADLAARERIRSEILAADTATADWENWCLLARPEGTLIVDTRRPEHAPLQGRTLADIARDRETHWIDAAIDLILAERQAIGTVYEAMSEDNLRLAMRQPWIKFVTDATALDPETATSLAHPRGYGTYPRILGDYVRDAGVLTLEDAVRKMTGAPAARIGLRDRGLLRPGFFADIVIFDPNTVDDRATFIRPHQLPEGIRHVLVNGTFVVRDGRHTGAKPGRFLRHEPPRL